MSPDDPAAKIRSTTTMLHILGSDYIAESRDIECFDSSIREQRGKQQVDITFYQPEKLAFFKANAKQTLSALPQAKQRYSIPTTHLIL